MDAKTLSENLHRVQEHLKYEVAQTARLRRIIQEYARHNEGCSAAHGDRYRCRCGWRELQREFLAPAEAATPVAERQAGPPTAPVPARPPASEVALEAIRVLDALGLALAGHHHAWTDEERRGYERTLSRLSLWVRAASGAQAERPAEGRTDRLLDGTQAR